MSAPVQGGIGAYHLLVSQGLMLYGLSQQDGLTFATLLHTLQLLLVVVFGVISLLLLFSENKKRAGNVQQDKKHMTFSRLRNFIYFIIHSRNYGIKKEKEILPAAKNLYAIDRRNLNHVRKLNLPLLLFVLP